MALLIDTDPFANWRGEQAHADGRPYTKLEAALSASATEAEWAAAIDLQMLSAEDMGERVRRRRRLDDIMLAAPSESLHAVVSQVQELWPDELCPALGQVPIAAMARWQDQQDAVLAAAIREHMLPSLSGELRAEAEGILEHLAPDGQAG